MEKTPLCVAFELDRCTKKSMNLKAGNEMINSNDRLNHFVRSELVKHLREKANLEGRQFIGDREPGDCLYGKEHPCYICIRVCPPTRRKMDGPNWYPTVKPLIDGLVDMGMFEDDNDQVITAMVFVPGVKTNNKKYLIILEIHSGKFEDRK